MRQICSGMCLILFCNLAVIAGDIIGSVYEFRNYRAKDFPIFNDRAKFTDDSVMTNAVADALMNNLDMSLTLKEYGRKYPNRGYGGMFYQWLALTSNAPYNRYGNGSAVRASAASFMAVSVEQACDLVLQSAEVTPNHPEGIKVSQAVAVAVNLAQTASSKEQIRSLITEMFG